MDTDSLMQDLALDAIQTLNLAESDAASAKALVQQTQAILAGYRSKVASINADSSLSETGKAARVATAADAAQRDLQSVASGQLAGIAASIVKLESILNPPVVPATDIATTMLIVERRSVLRQMDILEVGQALLAAAAEGDVLTVRAIVESPPFERTKILESSPIPAFAIDPQLVLKAKQIAAERERPEVAASLKALRSAYAQLEALLGDAQREIGGLPDPLMVAAGMAKGNGAGATA